MTATSEHLDETADEPTDEQDLAPVYSLPTRAWPFLWHFVRRYYLHRYVVMVLAVLVGQGLETLEPYVLKRMINALSDTVRTGASAAPVTTWFIVGFGLWAVSMLLMRVYQIVDIHTGPPLRAKVQKQMFSYLIGHSPRYFQENFAGKLGQKIKEAGRAILGILDILCFDASKITVILLVATTLMAVQAPLFAVLLLGWMAIYLAVTTTLARRCVLLSKAFSAAVSTSTGRLIDSIANADTVRSFAKAAFERRLLARYLDEEARRSIRLRWFLTMMRLFQVVAVICLLGVMVWLALRATLAGRLDLGSFTLVFTLSNFIAINVWNLSNRMLDFFEQIGTLTEAIELVTQPHEIVDRSDAKPLVVGPGAIAFREVSYAHPDGSRLFDKLNLELAAGEKVALVGPSGAGKSTLIKLLRRHFEPQGGRIEIDGQDIAGVTWDSLNEAIAEVSQLPGVFHRPLRDNIRYAREDAPEAAVIEAAVNAHSHEFIVSRPTGYDTIVGEQGIKLSGGERQRLAIARAILKDARILVLDEATSSLDSESEHRIQEALFALMEGRTVIAIAHRLSTITGMDRILYLESGRILEQGSHQALLRLNGRYARLWNRQVGGFLGAA
ncbi:MAG TPA: ABC transporter ATP-binding protein [Candidatus Acidoferrum sp.]|nr:ABC transporter ATP-binding protein [Candidatus Acidoferrum sp.]